MAGFVLAEEQPLPGARRVQSSSQAKRLFLTDGCAITFEFF
jgi:hypothetical protein